MTMFIAEGRLSWCKYMPKSTDNIKNCSFVLAFSGFFSYFAPLTIVVSIYPQFQML